MEQVDNLDPPFGASPPGTEQPEQCIPNTPASWFVGLQGDEVLISYVPGAGPWVKLLDVPTSVNPGFFDQLFEEIEVGAGQDWHDWHEEIQTPDWIFTNVIITTNPPSVVTFLPSGPTDVWVEFNPDLQTGTIISIQKTLEYTGQGISGPSVIEIWEYPTIDTQQVVAGETISIDSTALILLGAQSTMAWLIPIAISAVGIGIVIVRRKI